MKTSELANQLKISYWRIITLIRSGKISPPPKDYSGDYIWQTDDIEAVKEALSHKSQKVLKNNVYESHGS